MIESRGGACRVVIGAALSALLAAPLDAAAADALLYRIFLRDGSTVVSYGDFARVGDRVVFSVPIGPGDRPQLQLVSLAESAVDWQLTDRYADAARAKHYAETRGEDDFTRLSGDVARALNEVALTDDPARRIALADHARQQLAEWPAKHFGYRASDVAHLSALLEEVVSELRVAAGQSRFELKLVAPLVAPPPVALLPQPNLRESIELAFTAARVAAEPAERVALLESIGRVLGSPNGGDASKNTSQNGNPGNTAPPSGDPTGNTSPGQSIANASPYASTADPSKHDDSHTKSAASLDATWTIAMRTRAAAELAAERRVDRAYAQLAERTLARAADRANRSDVRAIDALIQSVFAADAKLGRARPAEIAALLMAVDAQKEAAQRLRLARDAWSVRAGIVRDFRRRLLEPLDRLARLKRWLEDVRQLAGPAPNAIALLEERATIVGRELALLKPPAELELAHTLLTAASGLAARAAATRRRAIASGDMPTAWEASSAAAGALMTLNRASSELDREIGPPKLK